jgi:hypothetical protein
MFVGWSWSWELETTLSLSLSHRIVNFANFVPSIILFYLSILLSLRLSTCDAVSQNEQRFTFNSSRRYQNYRQQQSLQIAETATNSFTETKFFKILPFVIKKINPRG